jgi:hypothetical protein
MIVNFFGRTTHLTEGLQCLAPIYAIIRIVFDSYDCGKTTMSLVFKAKLQWMLLLPFSDAFFLQPSD